MTQQRRNLYLASQSRPPAGVTCSEINGCFEYPEYIGKLNTEMVIGRR